MIVAWTLTAWAAYRWLGLALGLARTRRFAGEARAEAWRSCASRAGFNVFWSLVAFFAWMRATGLRPTSQLVGTWAMLLTVSIAAGTAAAFMQPKERTPETFQIFRLRRPRAPATAGS